MFKYELTERVIPVSGFAWRHSEDLTWDCLHTRHAGFGSRTKMRTSSRTVVYPERALWSDRLARRAPVGLRQPEAGRRRNRYVALPWFCNSAPSPSLLGLLTHYGITIIELRKSKAFL